MGRIFALCMASAIAFQCQAAGIYKCNMGEKSVFQQQPCQEGSQEALKEYKPVYGMHGSWFVTPSLTKYSTTCDASGCICGSHSVPFIGEDDVILIDAMSKLREAWRVYERLAEYHRVTYSQAIPGAEESAKDVGQAACDVTLQQRVIKELFEKSSKSLYEESRVVDAGFQRINTECERPEVGGWVSGEAANAYLECTSGNTRLHNYSMRKKRQVTSLVNSFEAEFKMLTIPRKTY